MSLANPRAENEPERWPALHTPHLTIREYDFPDKEPLFQLEGSEENARYQTWQPWTRAQAEHRIGEEMFDSYVSPRPVVELAVVLKEGGLVGRVGCRKSLVDGDGDGDGGGKDGVKRVHVSLWFSLLPSMQGKGLATEAVEAFVDEMARRERDGKEGSGEVQMELEIECDPRNAGSRKLAERLGFRKESEVEEAFECKGEMVGSVVYRKAV